MKYPNKELVASLRRQYPAGCRVELLRMDDVQAPPVGTQGTVIGVDDIGSVMVAWDNGSGLSVAYGADACRKVAKSMTEEIKEQVLSIRDTGLTNMLDTNTVQRIANDMGFYELVMYLEEHRREYWHFIMTGEA